MGPVYRRIYAVRAVRVCNVVPYTRGPYPKRPRPVSEDQDEPPPDDRLPSFPAAALRDLVSVAVSAPVAAVTAPVVLGHPALGTDRLVYVPRLRLSTPVVYVAMEPAEAVAFRGGPAYARTERRALYVGMTRDLDARRVRHESEADHGRAGSASGSVLVPGAWDILRADWFAVPVAAEHARRLEQALTSVLRPVMQKARAARLDARHRAALVAGGWTDEAAERIVDLSRAGLL